MASQWYYTSGDSEHGPISSPELKKLADSGGLSPEDQVWREGMDDWVPAKTIPKLCDNAPAAPKHASTVEASGAPVIDTDDGGAPAITTGDSGLSVGAGPPGGRSAGRAGAASTGEQARKAAQKAGEDALTALKTLVANPVGGLASAYEQLGPKQSLQVGAVFGVSFSILLVLGMVISSGFEAEPFFKMLFLSLSFPAGMMGGAALTRAIFGGKENFESDVFIGGAASLPIALFMLVGSILSKTLAKHPGFMMILLLFFFSTTVLMLYSGSTRIHKISEAVASLAVPLTITIASVAFYYICIENVMGGLGGIRL